MAQILLIWGEDERGMADGLRAAGLTVTLAPGDREWLPIASRADAVVLACKRASQVTDADRRQLQAVGIPVLGLASGLLGACEACGWVCDDLVMRPFTPEELGLRLKYLLEKTKREILRVGNLRLDPARGQVWRGAQELHLTRLEFDLLAYLLRNQGRLVSYDELLTAVWGCDWDEGSRQMVKTAVKRLRRKVEKHPSQPKRIVSMWGRGYRLEVPG